MKTKRRHRINYRAESEFNSTAIFITPMLDMAFQLLTFFVFTYHPSLLEGQFQVSFAAGAEGGKDKPKASDKPSPEKKTELPPPIRVVARATQNQGAKTFKGRLAQMEVILNGTREAVINVSNGTESDAAYEAKLRENLQTLEDLLKKLKKGVLPREDRLRFEAGYSLRWEETMRVFDACRRTKDRGQEMALFPKIELDTLSPRVPADK